MVTLVLERFIPMAEIQCTRTQLASLRAKRCFVTGMNASNRNYVDSFRLANISPDLNLARCFAGQADVVEEQRDRLTAGRLAEEEDE